MPYTDDTYVVSEVFNTLLIKYRLTKLGKYRFRARFVKPETYGAGAAPTPWTDWRQIEVLGKTNMLGPANISLDKPTSNMQKVEGRQLQPKTSAEKLQLQGDKVAPTVTVKKSKFKLKTVPVIAHPQEFKQIARRGSVVLKVKGIEDKDQLDWQIEYKKFGTSKFSRSRHARPQVVGENNQVAGSFYASQEGDYRIRVRSNEKGSLWSPWRLFRVGKPKDMKIEERSLKPTVKNPTVKNSLALEVENPEQKEPKTINPTEKSETSKFKEPSGHDYKPIIINNS